MDGSEPSRSEGGIAGFLIRFCSCWMGGGALLCTCILVLMATASDEVSFLAVVGLGLPLSFGARL